MINKTKKIVKYINKTQKVTTEITLEKLKLMKRNTRYQRQVQKKKLLKGYIELADL